MRVLGLLLLLLAAVQSLIVVEARDLVTGIHGMADIVRHAMPPDFSKLQSELWLALETIDIAIFGTLAGVLLAIPLAVPAAFNVTPSRPIYYIARGIIGFTRAVPDLVWALLFVTAVGLGPFPGGLADRRAGSDRRAATADHKPRDRSVDPAVIAWRQPLPSR